MNYFEQRKTYVPCAEARTLQVIKYNGLGRAARLIYLVPESPTQTRQAMRHVGPTLGEDHSI